MEKLYTVNEIATMTRLSTRTIRRYLSNGELSGQKIGRQWRFTQSDLENFLDSQALIDVLDEAEQTLKQQFSTGKINIAVENPQADLTIIQAYHSASDLQDDKTALLTHYNERETPANFSLSMRVLANHHLRIVLFGDLPEILTFATHLNERNV